MRLISLICGVDTFWDLSQKDALSRPLNQARLFEKRYEKKI